VSGPHVGEASAATSEPGWLKLQLKDVLDRRRDVIFSPHTRLLVYLAVKSKGGRRVVPLTNMMAAEVGLHRQQKSRSLRHLEQNGYVKVERCGQEAPRVTVLVREAR
jgi:DNA-binding MarR family transcriptional regulator